VPFQCSRRASRATFVTLGPGGAVQFAARGLFLFLILLCVASHLGATCLVQAVSSIAPTDGGSATLPALITPSIAGVPAQMGISSSNAVASDLLIYDSG